MAAQNNAQTIALQLEKVRDKVPLLYERDDVLLTMIQQRGDIEKVSSRNMRLPSATGSRRQGRELQRRRRRPGARLGHHVRRRASLAHLFPVRGGNHQAGRIRLEHAGKSHRKRREARNRQRHEAIPRVPRQSDSDRGQRRARHDQRVRVGLRGQSGHLEHEHSQRRGAGLRRANHPGLRPDAHDQSRLVRCHRGGSDFVRPNDQRGHRSGRHGRERRDRARRAQRARRRYRCSASSIIRTTRPRAPGST